MIRRRPLAFLLGVLPLSLPFVLLNFTALPDPFGLPPSALMIVVPALLAMVMAHRDSVSIRGVWRPVLPTDEHRSLVWTGFAFAAVPLLLAGSHLVSTLTGFGPVAGVTSTALTPLLFAVYLLGAVPEEIGWTMYATRPLQARLGVFGAGLVIGVTWELWHVLPFISQARSASWILGQVATGIALRVLMGHVFANTGGSLLPAVVMHTAINAWPHLLPGGMASYHPEVLAVLSWLTVAVVHRCEERRTRRGTAFMAG